MGLSPAEREQIVALMKSQLQDITDVIQQFLAEYDQAAGQAISSSTSNAETTIGKIIDHLQASYLETHPYDENDKLDVLCQWVAPDLRSLNVDDTDTVHKEIEGQLQDMEKLLEELEIQHDILVMDIWEIPPKSNHTSDITWQPNDFNNR